MIHSYSVLLICVNETVYFFGNLPFFKIHVNRVMARADSPGANVISMHVMGEGPGAILWVLRHFLCLISRLRWHPTPVFLPGESQGRGTRWAAVYGVAQSRTRLKRLSSSSSSSYITSGWRLGRGTFSAPSDVYVKSLLYLFYTLIKLYYTKFWAIKPRHLPWIEFFFSGDQESWCLLWFSNKLLLPNYMNLENDKKE